MRPFPDRKEQLHLLFQRYLPMYRFYCRFKRFLNTNFFIIGVGRPPCPLWLRLWTATENKLTNKNSKVYAIYRLVEKHVVLSITGTSKSTVSKYSLPIIIKLPFPSKNKLLEANELNSMPPATLEERPVQRFMATALAHPTCNCT